MSTQQPQVRVPRGLTLIPEVKGVPPGLTAEPSNGSTKNSPTDYDTLAKKYGGVVAPKPPATNGIKTIFWNPDFSVDFFVMQDGEYVSSGPSPSAWSYLLWVAFPVLGFLALWKRNSWNRVGGSRFLPDAEIACALPIVVAQLYPIAEYSTPMRKAALPSAPPSQSFWIG